MVLFSLYENSYNGVASTAILTLRNMYIQHMKNHTMALHRSLIMQDLNLAFTFQYKKIYIQWTTPCSIIVAEAITYIMYIRKKHTMAPPKRIYGSTFKLNVYSSMYEKLYNGPYDTPEVQFLLWRKYAYHAKNHTRVLLITVYCNVFWIPLSVSTVWKFIQRSNARQHFNEQFNNYGIIYLIWTVIGKWMALHIIYNEEEMSLTLIFNVWKKHTMAKQKCNSIYKTHLSHVQHMKNNAMALKLNETNLSFNFQCIMNNHTMDNLIYQNCSSIHNTCLKKVHGTN